MSTADRHLLGYGVQVTDTESGERQWLTPGGLCMRCPPREAKLFTSAKQAHRAGDNARAQFAGRRAWLLWEIVPIYTYYTTGMVRAAQGERQPCDEVTI